MYKMKQRKIDCSIGFVEVKSEKSDSIKRHEDMVQLVVYCKDALEVQSTKAMIAVQVVGKSLQIVEKGQVISKPSCNSTTRFGG